MIPMRFYPAFALLLLPTLTAISADDPYGDPLPEGAKLRLGTARMRINYTNNPTALTPDGKFLVARAPEGGIAYIDPATGKTTRRVETQGEFGSLVGFSTDGHRAVGSGFHVASVLDIETGKVLVSLKRTFAGGDHSLSLAADGKRLAVGGSKSEKEKATAVVWDVDGNKPIASVTPVQNQTVYVALSPDGKRLATWGYHSDPEAKGPPDEATDPNRTFQFWDAVSGKELGKGRVQNIFSPVSIVFAPDRSVAAVSGGNGQIQLFDPTTGAAKGVLLGRTGVGRRIAFSPDGKTLAASGEDGAVQRWSLPEGKRLGVIAPPIPITYSPQAIQFIDNERLVVWGTRGMTAVVWEVPSGKLLSPAGGNFSNITGIAVAEGGKELLTAAGDGAILTWDPATGKQRGTLDLKSPSTGYGSSVVTSTVMLTADGTVALAYEGGNNGLGIYDVATGMQQFVIPGDNNRQSIGAFTLDGRKVVQILTSYDIKKNPPRVAVWDIATAEKLGGVELGAMNQIVATITPDGKTLITAATKVTEKGPGDFVVTGWELATGKKLGEFSEASAYGSTYILPTADNKSVIVATPKGRFVVIDAVAGKQVRELDSGGRSPAVAPIISSDMKTVALAQPLTFGPGGTATILLIDIESGKVKRTLSGPSANPTVLAFSPDGRKLFAGSSDTTVLMWDLAVE
ncbi:MAG TPA: WD40 repeat domain-containing protein [Gemmata sp.]|nr:WD40 repeat domain-containing protein [Gemmata sp.]